MVDPDVNALKRLDLPAATLSEIARWTTDRRYASERAALAGLIGRALAGDRLATSELEDAFDGPLPIGTGGRRGVCGPGTNRMNTVVLRETAQGLADAMRAEGVPTRVAIVYDTRRDSRPFAYAVAAQLAANAIEVVLVDAPRPTPQLSFMVIDGEMGAGVVISASHNPPSDNGIKVYGPDGAQVLGRRDQALMAAIRAAMDRGVPDAAPDSPFIHVVEGPAALAEVDGRYLEFVRSQGVSGDLTPAGLRVVYTPLHGVGHTAVLPVLRAQGVFVEMVEAQGPDDGAFATVKSANPEAPDALALARDQADRDAADLVIANDPDADRMGILARDGAGDLQFIDGNRLGVLMLDHVLRHAALPPRGWVLSTLVTTSLVGKLARAAGVDVVDDLLVGFKHHAGMLAEAPERPLVFAAEESHGYLRGNRVHDKDGAIAALLMCEAAAAARIAGRTVFDELARIWGQHGYHRELTANLYAYGAAGREAIAGLVDSWRTAPPQAFAGLPVTSTEDRSRPRDTGSPTRDLSGNVLVFTLAPETGGSVRLVVRPSGTEPKAKVYVLAAAEAVGRPPSPAECEVVDHMARAVLDDARQRAEATMRPWLRD